MTARQYHPARTRYPWPCSRNDWLAGSLRKGLSAEVQETLITTPSDPLALLRSKSYLALPVLPAIIGLPVSAAYFFLALVSSRRCGSSQTCPRTRAFTPNRCGSRSRRWGGPGCWSLSPSGTCQVRAAATRQPTGSRRAKARPSPGELPGIVLAAFATLSLGVVLGPEALVIALGGGLGVLAVRFVRRDEPIAALDLIHGLGRAWSGRRFLRGTVGA